MRLSSEQSDLLLLDEWVKKRSEQGAIAVVSHKNGDMDTISSAVVLANLLGRNAQACGIHRSRLAVKMMDNHGGKFIKIDEKNPLWPRTLSGVIVVDCASIEQTGLTLPSDTPICAIDHHTGGSNWNDAELLINWPKSSTAEIIFDFATQFYPNALDQKSASLLLAGIITDTGRFKHADSAALLAAGTIVKQHQINFPQFIEEMENTELNSSQRFSIAKALARTESLNAGDWFLLHTRGSTCESVVAHSLLSAGAEVALVVRRAKDETRLIGRASHRAVSEGIHLGNIFSSLEETIDGEGGGHAGAAGWSGDVPPITASSAFIAALSAVKRD